MRYDKEQLTNAIDALAMRWDTSAAISVSVDQEEFYTKAFGYADRAKGEKLTLDARFCLPLRSGFLLALAILHLAEAKKLKLTDTLDNYLPQYCHAHRITIRHLLQGASGIPDYLTQKVIAAMEKEETHRSLPKEERFVKERLVKATDFAFEDVIALIGEDPLDFVPGESCENSNTEPVFLQAIVERAAGTGLFAYLSKYVFEPLGMTDTLEGNCANTAFYGCMNGTELVRVQYPARVPAFTSTLADMTKLAGAMTRGELLSKKSWALALHPNADGAGLGFESLNGTFIAYGSETLGSTLRLYFSPKSKLYYVILMNEEQKDAYIDGDFHAFAPDVRREIEAAFTYPEQPKLVPYGKRNAWDALSLTIAEDQRWFVLDAKTSLAITLADKSHKRAFVLMEGSRAIGLIVLFADKKKQKYDVDIVLIDKRFQGRGYGKIMVRQGVEYLRGQGAKELTIGVNRRNIVAKRLYESVGFRPVEVFDEGMRLQLRFED